MRLALFVVLLATDFPALLGPALLGIGIAANGRSDSRLADNLKQEADLEAAGECVEEQATFETLATQDPLFGPMAWCGR